MNLKKLNKSTILIMPPPPTKTITNIIVNENILHYL